MLGGVDMVRFIEVFFFFQAEDGIRDYKVTGVQTCALPISNQVPRAATMSLRIKLLVLVAGVTLFASTGITAVALWRDRKSTRLNSSHLVISYAVFCLKKKK